MCSTPLSAAAEAFKDSSQGWRGHLPVAQRQVGPPRRQSRHRRRGHLRAETSETIFPVNQERRSLEQRQEKRLPAGQQPVLA